MREENEKTAEQALFIYTSCSPAVTPECVELLCVLGLPNVTSRVLVEGLRLGMAEQHCFPGVASSLVPGVQGRRGEPGGGGDFAPAAGFTEVYGPTSSPASFYRPSDVIRTHSHECTLDDLWEARPLPLPLPSLLKACWDDALKSFTWPVVDTDNFKLTQPGDVWRSILENKQESMAVGWGGKQKGLLPSWWTEHMEDHFYWCHEIIAS